MELLHFLLWRQWIKMRRCTAQLPMRRQFNEVSTSLRSEEVAETWSGHSWRTWQVMPTNALCTCVTVLWTATACGDYSNPLFKHYKNLTGNLWSLEIYDRVYGH
jgi:hypothetical protein